MIVNITLQFNDKNRGVEFYTECQKVHLSGIKTYIAFTDAQKQYHRIKLNELQNFSITTYNGGVRYD